jgi:hypothetical protein
VIAHFTDLLIIAISFLLMFFAYNGWGSLLVRLLKFEFDEREKKYVFTWMGWALSLLILNIYNLMLPVNIYFSSLFFGTGIVIYFIFYVKKGCFVNTKRIFANNRIPLLIKSLLSVIIASRAMLSPSSHDSGLYHFNSVRWLNEYAIVPGLGNLHGRLAFNQSFFIFLASLNFYPYYGYGHNLANSFLIIVLMVEYISCVTTYIRNLKSERSLFEVNGVVSLLFLLALLFYAIISPISSPTPDVASFVLQLLLFTHFLRLIVSGKDNDQMLSRVGFIVIIAATAVTIKLSNIFFAGIIVIAALLYFIKARSKISKKLNIAPLFYAIIIAGLIITVWVSRGYISSGYPFYPATFGGIDTEWTVPVEEGQKEAGYVYNWARYLGTQPYEGLNNWDWFVPWARNFIRQPISFIYSVLAVVSFLMITVAAILFFIRRGYKKSCFKLRFSIPLIMVIASLLFWFLAAPSYRFANALFFILPVMAFMFLSDQLSEKVIRVIWNMRSKIIISGLVLMITLMSYWIFIVLDVNQKLKIISTTGIEPIPTAELKQLETKSGIKVWLPVEGDQCWNSPLPATPYYKHNLDLRGDSIQEGFVIRD